MRHSDSFFFVFLLVILFSASDLKAQNIIQLRLLEKALTKKFENVDAIAINSLSAREKQFVSRFPEIDSDQNGIVTKEEAMSFKRAILGESSKDNPAVNLNNIVATHSHVTYGPHERNVLDIWLAKSEQPTPLVIFIHGGGFKYGDKSIYFKNKEFSEFYDQGFSVATINYRFLKHTESSDGLLGCLRDVALAVQFLRSKSEEWGIDREKIAAVGCSAGGGAALYLATRDDLADPESSNPILRESTRLKVVGVTEAQATYDFRKWQQILELNDREMEPLLELAIQSYALPKNTTIQSQALAACCQEMDLLGWLDANDAPVWIRNIGAAGKTLELGEQFHHPSHVSAFKKRADEVGLTIQAYAPELGINPPVDEQMSLIDFVVLHLKSP